MNQDRHIWRVWVSFLQRWGVEDWTATMLETVGPLSILGAQVLHLSRPLLGQALCPTHLDALARLLEEPTQTQAFVHYLREANRT